jgi:hypothetical protein
MGNDDSKSTKKDYNIPFNKKLNDEITKRINLKVSKNDESKFKKFLHKKFQKDFVVSNFSSNFDNEDKAINKITTLLNLIYTKNTDNNLKISSNRTIYETVFNYDIVEKESKDYNKFNKNMIMMMRNFIHGNEDNNDSNDKFDINKNSEIFMPIETIKSIENEKIINNSGFSKNSKQILFYNNNRETNNSNNNQINITDNMSLNSMKTKKSLDSNAVKNKIMLNEKLNNNINTNINSNTNNNIESLNNSNNFDGSIKLNLSNINKKSRSKSKDKKTKHNKIPKNKPIVTIKINIKDLMKEDFLEKSILEPNERYKRCRSPNNKEYSNYYNIRKELCQNNSPILSNKEFIEKIDVLSQPNKLKKDLIHNQMSPKSNNKKNYLSPNRISNQYKNIIEKSKKKNY